MQNPTIVLYNPRPEWMAASSGCGMRPPIRAGDSANRPFPCVNEPSGFDVAWNGAQCAGNMHPGRDGPSPRVGGSGGPAGPGGGGTGPSTSTNCSAPSRPPNHRRFSSLAGFSAGSSGATVTCGSSPSPPPGRPLMPSRARRSRGWSPGKRSTSPPVARGPTWFTSSNVQSRANRPRPRGMIF